ncbi:MAG: polyprenyl synthetase family protein [Parachlamydiaceae bacterium]|nr:polyprenyl synthetase family protein [Parachlamydiaceae bacterium]
MQKNNSKIDDSLSQYRVKFEKLLNDNLSNLGDKSTLRDACAYALLNGGKRFRPFLVHLVANAVRPGALISQASIAVEYFHTASLIADDLPCMDDDDLRRDVPSLHKAFNESTALLASYALIASGYGALAKNARQLVQEDTPYAQHADAICTLAIENVSYNTGLWGATGGQYLDIFPPDLTFATIKDVIYKKTVSLFEISFVLGWLYAGGNMRLVEDVKKAAANFGMAFQIADDIGDQEQDQINGRKINVATIIGQKQAVELFHEEMNSYKKHLSLLGIATPELLGLADAASFHI